MRSKYSLYETLDQALAADRKAGFRIVRSKLVPNLIFAFADRGVYSLKAYVGDKATKPRFYYSFRTPERREAYAKEFAESEAANQAYKAKHAEEKKQKRANLKASDFWQVGDVVYTSWGYDQTNVEYYQILEVKARSVKIQQIKVNSSDQPGSPTGGLVQPRRGEFVGNPYLSPIDENGGFTAGPTWKKSKPSFRHRAYKWNGKAKYTSSYH
jgi:hypothetical protein